MPEQEDHLSNELAISAALDSDKNQIKASVKSRAISSIDRLVGAFFDVKTARLEKAAEDIRNNKDDHGGPLLLTQEDRIDAGIRERELRKLTNKMKVVEAALEDLKNSMKESEDTDEPISEDWLNYFESHAENVSSEDLQGIWARVLAGEIRKPRSFSLRTLRFLSEIDSTTAKIFERFVSDRIADDHVLSNSELEGDDLMDAIELEEAGLLQEAVHSKLQRTFRVDDSRQALISDSGFIAVITVLEGTTELKYNFVKITRIGKELCNLLVLRDPVISLETMTKHFIEKNLVEKAVIGKIVEQKGSKVKWIPVKEIQA